MLSFRAVTIFWHPSQWHCQNILLPPSIAVVKSKSRTAIPNYGFTMIYGQNSNPSSRKTLESMSSWGSPSYSSSTWIAKIQILGKGGASDMGGQSGEESEQGGTSMEPDRLPGTNPNRHGWVLTTDRIPVVFKRQASGLWSNSPDVEVRDIFDMNAGGCPIPEWAWMLPLDCTPAT